MDFSDYYEYRTFFLEGGQANYSTVLYSFPSEGGACRIRVSARGSDTSTVLVRVRVRVACCSSATADKDASSGRLILLLVNAKHIRTVGFSFEKSSPCAEAILPTVPYLLRTLPNSAATTSTRNEQFHRVNLLDISLFSKCPSSRHRSPLKGQGS